ncbi:hypothetical protein TNIN_173511 [Trichonephila inaurata madagascariensis]|uniref:Uncharacterized protein n=1 Tax=Trichonephila inaurata madagascariensis TaxID=2747483 RepID=A0A8X6YWS6_9ARAC|nr:hypothetical protein TNIN_173511 [Trichonephila inaurata madagascariensis]
MRTESKRLPEKQNIVKRRAPSSLQEDKRVKNDPMGVTSGGKGQLHSHYNRVQGQRRYPGEISTRKVKDPEREHRM